MVRLERIRKTRDSFKCDVYLEDSKNPVAVEYSLADKQLSQYTLPASYSWCTTHMAKVERFLAKLEEKTAIPERKTIMWY